MKQTLQSWLAEGKIAKVIEHLSAVTTDDKDLQQEVIAIAARFAHYEKQLHGKTADADWLGKERNQINAALLYIIEKLPNDVSISSNDATPTQEKATIQNAEKIYNIDHIDNANFS